MLTIEKLNDKYVILGHDNSVITTAMTQEHAEKLLAEFNHCNQRTNEILTATCYGLAISRKLTQFIRYARNMELSMNDAVDWAVDNLNISPTLAGIFVSNRWHSVK
jgi:hypothetical protein